MMKYFASYQRCQGFTLIELIIVLLIVGVMAAIAAPRFAQATARQQLNAAADRVVADLEKASTRARAASETATLRFYTGSEKYVANAVGGDTYKVELDASPYNVDISAANFGSDKIAQFNAYGVPVDAGTVTLKRGDNSITITLGTDGRVTR